MRWKDTRDYVYVSDDDAEKPLAHISPKFLLPAKILRLYGMRVSEVLGLTPANFRDGELIVKRLKKGRLTKQIIHRSIKRELTALINQRSQVAGPDAKLFPFTRTGFWCALQTAAMRADEPTSTPARIPPRRRASVGQDGHNRRGGRHDGSQCAAIDDAVCQAGVRYQVVREVPEVTRT